MATIPNNTNMVPTTMTTITGQLSPRADLWAYLVASSVATIATLSMASTARMQGGNTGRSTLETVAISIVSLALIIAIFVSLEFRFQPSRDRLTQSFGNMERITRGTQLTMELIVASLNLILWCVIMGLVFNGSNLAVEGLQTKNANLFYATWISFGLTGYIVADLISTDDPSGVLPYHDSQPKNQATRTWLMLGISSLLLLSFNLAVGTGVMCSGGMLQNTTLCQYTIVGALCGLAGLSASVFYLFVERVLTRKPPLLGICLSVVVTILFAINAGLNTSMGSPGSEPSSIYWSSWVCVALSFYLCVCHVEMILALREPALSATEEETRVVGSGPPSETVPLVPQQQHQQVHQMLTTDAPLKPARLPRTPASATSSSGSTYSGTSTSSRTSTSDSTSSDEDSSSSSSGATGEGEEEDSAPSSHIEVFLPSNGHSGSSVTSSITGVGKKGTGGSHDRFLYNNKAAQRPPPPKAIPVPSLASHFQSDAPSSRKTYESRKQQSQKWTGETTVETPKTNPKSVQAREEKKQQLFDNMSSFTPSVAPPRIRNAASSAASKSPMSPPRSKNAASSRAASKSPMTPPISKNATSSRASSKSPMSVAPTRKLRNVAKATSSVATATTTATTSKPGFKQNLNQYLTGLVLPDGLISTVSRNYNSCDSRLWLIDNSASMMVRDSHLIGGSLDRIQRTSDASRWQELQECVAFHAKMSARCWIPTKFWLVNNPGPSARVQKFSLCWSTPQEIGTEMNHLKRTMTTATPTVAKNPLAHQVRSVHRGIAKEAPRLLSQGKHITFILCTQGVPTDAQGRTGPAVLKEFQEVLYAMSKLPVKIVFRLCTDDQEVREIYNTIDSKLDFCDVLDDFWGEAMEVYLHNPWLAYGIGIHRLREAGLAWCPIIDNLDTRPLSLDEIYEFCKNLFFGEDKQTINLPHPRNWMSFMRGLTEILKKQKPIWNPIFSKQTSWINLTKLHSIYGTQGQSSRSTSVATASTNSSLSPQQIIRRWSHQPPDYRKLYPLQQLLVTVPELFPPTNTKVEPHEYFDKWKIFAKDAFPGNFDDPSQGPSLSELLKRAVRKAKFFLHPDRLPNDLTENQALLFRTLWDVIQEQELATLK